MLARQYTCRVGSMLARQYTCRVGSMCIGREGGGQLSTDFGFMLPIAAVFCNYSCVYIHAIFSHRLLGGKLSTNSHSC
jgi:hypothetical protein